MYYEVKRMKVVPGIEPGLPESSEESESDVLTATLYNLDEVKRQNIDYKFTKVFGARICPSF
jgi:hypothetical protein